MGDPTFSLGPASREYGKCSFQTAIVKGQGRHPRRGGIDMECQSNKLYLTQKVSKCDVVWS